MAITIVATVGGASSNSYQTLEQVSTRAELLPGYTAWTGLADDAARNWCVVHATTLLDKLDWLGTKASQTQALKLPRYNLPNVESGCSHFGRSASFASDAIPEPVLKAHAIIAVGLASLSGRDGGTIAAVDAEAITSARIGDIAFTVSGATSAKLNALDFPGVAELLEGMHA